MNSRKSYQIGPWTVLPMQGRLETGSEVRHLEPKAMQLLQILVAHGPDVVSRQALQDAIWPDVVVSDHALTRLVSQLRSVIDDQQESESMIETIPKIGYRLVANTQRSQPEPESSARDSAVAETASDADKPSTGSPRIDRPGGFPDDQVRFGVTGAAGFRRLIGVSAALLAVVIIAWKLEHSGGTQSGSSSPFIEAVPLINSAAHESRPSVVGDLLAYAIAKPGEDSDVMLTRRVDGAVIRAFETDDHETFPSISPDGSRLAFVTRNDEPDECAIVVVNLLLEYTSNSYRCRAVPIMALAWSLDSETLVYSEAAGLMELSLKSGRTRLLISEQAVSRFMKPQFISSEVIAFISIDSNSGRSTIRAFDRSSGELSVLHESDHWLSDFFHAEDHWILASYRPGDSGIWRLTEGKEEKLSDSPAQDVVVVDNAVIFTRVLADGDICLVRRDIELIWDCDTALSSTAMDNDPELLGANLIGFRSNRSGVYRYYLYDLKSQRMIPPLDGIEATGPVAFLNNETLAFSEGDQLVFWNIPTAGVTHTVRQPMLRHLLGSLDGRYLLGLNSDSHLEVIDLNSNERRILGEGLPTALSFDQQGRILQIAKEAVVLKDSPKRWVLKGKTMTEFTLEPDWPASEGLDTVTKNGEDFYLRNLLRSTQVISENGQVIFTLHSKEMSARRLDFIVSEQWFAREYISKFSMDLYELELGGR